MSNLQSNNNKNNNNESSDVYTYTMNDQVLRRNELTGPIYDVQHLATFAVSTKEGLLRAEDGMRKLRLMEKTQGIWTMDCEIMIEKKNLIIFDKKTGQEVEVIPLSLVHEPTSIISDDKKDIYNNILLFTVLEDPKKKNSAPSEMHIFQCVKNNSGNIVDEIIQAKEGKQINNSRIFTDARQKNLNNNSQSDGFDLNRQNLLSTFDANINNQNRIDPRNMYPTRSNNMTLSFNNNNIYNESIDQDVQILNHCFDDIERFVTRLQNSSDYHKELERRRKQRKSHKKHIGDGMLNLRSQMPSQQQFYDIFQKFKLSFNLLAKLKAHIHDPNAPELIHFLFTPLSLILNATKDLQSNRGLTKTVWSPLLTKDAKELLLNCLTSKEQDLWQSLGDAWITTKDDVKRQQITHPLEPYNPIFYDGWTPILDDNDAKSDISQFAINTAHQAASSQFNMPKIQKQSQQSQQRQIQQFNKGLSSANNSNINQRSVISNNNIMNNAHNSGVANVSLDTTTASMLQRREDEMNNWALDLLAKGSKIYQVLHDRQGTNLKELTVKTGELVEVLDDRRNWWRVRNFFGQIGHTPNTILQPYETTVNNNYPHAVSTLNNHHINHQLNPEFQTFDNEKNGANGTQRISPNILTQQSNIIVNNNSNINNNNIISNNNSSNNNNNNDIDIDARLSSSNIFSIKDLNENQIICNSPKSNNNNNENLLELHTSRTQSSDKISLSNRQNIMTNTIYDVQNNTNELNNAIKMDNYNTISEKLERDTQPLRDSLHEELMKRVTNGKMGQFKEFNRKKIVNYINQDSNAEDVRNFLQSKGFSSRIVYTFGELTGKQLFTLNKNDFEKYCGKEEGQRLDSQITVQKSLSGYAERNSNELNEILKKRKEKAETNSQDSMSTSRPFSDNNSNNPDGNLNNEY